MLDDRPATPIGGYMHGRKAFSCRLSFENIRSCRMECVREISGDEGADGGWLAGAPAGWLSHGVACGLVA